MITLTAILLFILSSNEKLKKNRLYFKLLSFLFFYIGLDEIFCLHEQFVNPLKNLLNTSGYLHYAWVIPYGILVIIISLFFYSFINTFPTNIRNTIFLSGFIYVLGEMIFESISGNIISLYGNESTLIQPQIFNYSFLVTIEESLGLFGILLFNYALLKLLKIKNERIKIMIL